MCMLVGAKDEIVSTTDKYASASWTLDSPENENNRLMHCYRYEAAVRCKVHCCYHI